MPKVLLSISEDIKGYLQEQADLNCRSISGQIVYMLKNPTVIPSSAPSPESTSSTTIDITKLDPAALQYYKDEIEGEDTTLEQNIIKHLNERAARSGAKVSSVPPIRTPGTREITDADLKGASIKW